MNKKICLSFNLLSGQQRIEYINEHFVYEVDMFVFSALRCAKREADWHINSSNLECFLLHGRNLYEFFYDDGKGKDTCFSRAHHFMGLIKWEDLRPSKTERIKDFKIRVNHELAHFGYNRHTQVEKKIWFFIKLLRDFREIINIFIDNLPRGYHEKRLKQLRSNINKIEIK